MSNEEANTTKTEVVLVTTTELMWQSFRDWMDQQGCTTLAEGIRAAMREVTRSKVESQG